MKKAVNSYSAFTLIELLVVITIIAILSALLMPILCSAKTKVRRTTCSNNLRQINLGVRMYCDDSGDTALIWSQRLHRDVAAEVRTFKFNALHGSVGGSLGGA